MNDSTRRLDTAYISRLTVSEDLVVATYLLLLGALAFCLNALVIYTCLKHWRSLAISDYYILSLACSDVLLPLSSFPFAILSSFNHRWLFGDTGCVVFGFIGFFFGIVSIATVTVMGVMRYISICQPQIKVKSRSCVIITTIFPYIYALFWSCLPLMYFGSYKLEPYGTSCTLNADGQRPFTVIMSMFCVCIPFLIIIFAYGQIILRYQKSGRNIQKQSKKMRKKSRKESFLLKITFIMFWSFLLSWLPYMISSLQAADGTQSIRFAVFATLMSKTSTVLNPIIYFLMSKKFRPLLMHTCSFSKSSSSHKGKFHSWKVILKVFNIYNWIINNSSGDQVGKPSCSEVQKVETKIIFTGFQESVKI